MGRMFPNLNIKTFYETSYTLYNSMLGMNKKNQILEPLSCLVRLGMIKYKEKGIKISIHDNKISFHDPNFYQGTIRWHSGDNRNDLHNLCNPIIKCTEWYDTTIPEIKNIIY